MKHFKDLAEFLGEKSGVQVVFKAGATPCTNGKRITLPLEASEDGARKMLAALLHEAAHVRRTDFNVAPHRSPAVHLCLNALEDIRIDAATVAEYPNARQLFDAVYDDITTRNGAALRNEPRAVQIIKAAILRAAGRADVAEVFGAEVEAEAVKLDGYTARAKAAKTTAEIEADARELARILLTSGDDEDKDGNTDGGEAGDDEGEDTEDGEGGTEGEGGNAGDDEDAEGEDGDTASGEAGDDEDGADDEDGEDTDADDTEGGDAGGKGGKRGKGKGGKGGSVTDAQGEDTDGDADAGDDEDGDTFGERYGEAADKETEARETLEDLQKKKAEAEAREQAANDESASAHRSMRTYQNKANKETDTRKEAELSKKAEAARRRWNKANEDINAARSDKWNAEAELAKAADAYEAAAREVETLEGEKVGDGRGIELNGFAALDASAFDAGEKHGEALSGADKLEDTIRDAFIAKRDTEHADDGGAKLNARQLSALAAGIEADDFFISSDDKEHKTRAAFVIDNSGSMNRRVVADFGVSRERLANDAAAALLDACKKAIDLGAPLDFDVYAFGTRAIKIFDGAEDYTRGALAARIGAADSGGGTSLLEAVNTVAAELKEKAADGARVIVIITDAEAGEQDLAELRNGALLDGEKVLFIGADIDTRRNKAALHLFGKYNLTDRRTAADTLAAALLEAAQV